MRVLVWFRRDLRVRDHKALYEASRAATEGVVGVFLVCADQWRRHHDAACKVRFWLDNLRGLSVSLSKLNIPLLVRATPDFNAASQALYAVAVQSNCRGVYFNLEYEVNERRRDEDVMRFLVDHGIAVNTYHDRILIDPAAVRTKQGGRYTVFSPYRKAWLVLARRTDLQPVPHPRSQPETGIEPSRILEEVEGFDLAGPRTDLWPAGEDHAHRRLDNFIDKKLSDYHEKRDLPGVSGTSLLSPYLAAGVLSPRQCLQAALAANNGRLDDGDEGCVTWITELIWREFYTHILVAFPRVSMNLPFDLKTQRIHWRTDEAAVEAWKEGLTGYPLVDAAMRQLKQTGWMHNRLRMVAAMFFSKHLLIDWRVGERYFMGHLIDGDLAANNGGWQWAASTGTDAAPYFRIFNPYRQSKRFDPQGGFIKRFCPQLANLSGEALHDPQKLTSAQRNKIDYPPPIVDHKQARARAIEAFR